MNNSQRIWSALENNNIDAVAYLPCNKLNALMLHKPDNIDIWDITKESAGLGLCFGRSLAGKRSAMMIQNTGLGNLVTELYTLQKLYQAGLPIFVSWRGHYQEPIEAQIIFGDKVESLLQAIDVEYHIIANADDLSDINEKVAACFNENKITVFLLSPEVWEQNNPDYHAFGQPIIKPVSMEVSGYKGKPSVTRIGAIKTIMGAVDEQDVVISQIGFPSKEVYNTKDRETNFYMLGALGAATHVGIGLAKSIENKHVYVIDGDGSFFFNPNQLIDLAWFNPANLSIICLDNGSWGSTGNQPTLSSQGYNLSAVVQSLGVTSQCMTDQPDELTAAMKNKTKFIHYMINPGNDKVGGEIPLKALKIKQRFTKALAT